VNITNSVLSSMSRRSIQTPRFPWVLLYPAMPVSCMYRAYASPSDLATAPRQIRAIIGSPSADCASPTGCAPESTRKPHRTACGNLGSVPTTASRGVPGCPCSEGFRPVQDARTWEVAAMTGVLAAQVIPARAQMASTLGFHIILASLGIALPTIVLLAEFIGLRRSDPVAMTLARRWSQAMAVLIAVGAVTGTVLSVEMGLLWPGVMRRDGAVLRVPLGVEGGFFFLEGIVAGIYLYGWRRVSGWAHFWTGVPIAVSGIFGAMSVIAVNSWMNQPGGFTERDGKIVSVNAWQVYFNHAALYEMPHMILAAYLVSGFLVAGVYATGILRGRRDRYHYTGFAIGFVPAALLTPFQIFVGDTAARAIARDQPIKFASMEYVPTTSDHVPEWLGGVYVNGRIEGGIRTPDRDSLLVVFTANTRVIGWDTVPAGERPPVVWLIHLSFDLMVALGFLLLLVGLWA